MGSASKFLTGWGRKHRKVSKSDFSLPPKAYLDPIQSLERRLLFSTASAPEVNLTWDGHAMSAYQDQYVGEVNRTELFDTMVAKKGFTNVTSLGGEGYYSFDSTLPIATMEKLAKNTQVFKVMTPNGIQTLASTLANDPLIGNQWGLDNTAQIEPYDYQGNGVVTPYNEVDYPTNPPPVINYPSPPYPNDNQAGTSGDDIDATQAWDITTGSKNVVVAVLDSGIDLTNPDLVSNIWTNPLDTAANNYDGDGYPNDINGFNFISDNSDVSDDNGHGTNVSGIIGASGNNQVGVSGVDWNVSLLPVKVAAADGSVPTSAEIEGINYCITLKDMGINIVVMNESLGGNTFPENVLENDAIAQAGKAGILDVVAAGNSSLDVDNQQTEPSKLSVNNSNVITVAAVDNQFNLAFFSNYGATSVDLAAPGVDIYSTSPTYAVTLNTEVAQEPDLPQFPEDYGYLSGTSQATPFVTGIIALEAAANPSATPLQLKTALLDGVTYDPKLAGVNGQPNKVLTVGVANAYKAVENILDPFVSSNTAHGGTWNNIYGSAGAYVVGDSTTFPSYMTVDQTGGSPVILSNSTSNLAALQRVSDGSERVSAYEASATNESININFTDGQIHQTSIYLADLDNKHRVETVAILNGDTGAFLNSQTISNFSKGEYLTWDLQGHVIIEVIDDSGPNAVYSGVFFDSPTTSPTASVGTDTTTGGFNWRNKYGSQGAVVVGDTSQLSAYVDFVNVIGETGVVLKSSTRAATSLQKVSDVSSGVEAYWSTPTSMDVNVGINDGLVHLVTLYVADYGNKHRQERIQAIDSATGAILAQQDVSNFSQGEYVSFRVLGSTTFRIINTAGPGAVLSGVFFDAPFGENSSFVGIDTTTGGNWDLSDYGLTTSYIVGNNFPGINDPFNPQITQVGGSQQVISLNSGSPTALAVGSGSSAQRVAAYLAAPDSMTLDYNPGDLLQHTIALYFADYDGYNRTEAVTLYNGNTMQVLSHQVLSNFQHGKYLVFDLSGPILIVINAGTYPNAVLSGVFTN